MSRVATAAPAAQVLTQLPPLLRARLANVQVVADLLRASGLEQEAGNSVSRCKSVGDSAVKRVWPAQLITSLPVCCQLNLLLKHTVDCALPALSHQAGSSKLLRRAAPALARPMNWPGCYRWSACKRPLPTRSSGSLAAAQWQRNVVGSNGSRASTKM
jgi:hypothetical protein